jgi:hypothetical protein
MASESLREHQTRLIIKKMSSIAIGVAILLVFFKALSDVISQFSDCQVWVSIKLRPKVSIKLRLT